MNQRQKLILVGAAIIIGLLQLAYFAVNGLRGSGWILSALAVTALLYFAFSGEEQHNRIADLKASGPTAANSAEHGVEVISASADDMSARLLKGFKGVMTNKGPFEVVTASMARSTLLMYAFGLYSISRVRHDSNYLSSPEHQTIKRRIAEIAAVSDNMILREVTGRELSPNSFDGDLLQVEHGIRSFFRALTDGRHASAASELNAWADKRIALRALVQSDLEDFTRSELRRVYRRTYGREPTNAR